MNSELRQELSAKIKDAYYHARDNGGTMHTAADDAADALLPIVERRIAQARAETAEQIAAAIEADYDNSAWIAAAARIARQHAEEVGSDG